MTSDGEALFRAVCENPADDTPRLVYADWLEEHGQPERAEFIRLQCEAWHLCPEYPDLTAARTRASGLLREHRRRWRAELSAVRGVSWGDLFVRGFIDSAWVRAGRDVRARLLAAFAATPLRHLTVVDFGAQDLAALLGMPEFARLAVFRRWGKGAGSGAGASELLAAARERFPHTEIE